MLLAQTRMLYNKEDCYANMNATLPVEKPPWWLQIGLQKSLELPRSYKNLAKSVNNLHILIHLNIRSVSSDNITCVNVGWLVVVSSDNITCVNVGWLNTRWLTLLDSIEKRVVLLWNSTWLVRDQRSCKMCAISHIRISCHIPSDQRSCKMCAISHIRISCHIPSDQRGLILQTSQWCCTRY